MGRKLREADSGQMGFDFRTPPAPELVTDQGQRQKTPLDPGAERKRVQQVLYAQHAAHVDGKGGQTTEVNGGRSTILIENGGREISSSPCGEAGEVYKFEPFPRPPDITPKQAVMIGLGRSGPKGKKKSLEPKSIYDDPDLVFHYQPDELADPTTRENVYKMVNAALAILRR